MKAISFWLRLLFVSAAAEKATTLSLSDVWTVTQYYNIFKTLAVLNQDFSQLDDVF